MRIPASVSSYSATLCQDLHAYPAIAATFRTCFPNALASTTEVLADGTTFVFTGDIAAMWLRDSTAQLHPYLPLAATDPDMRDLLRGLIRRQAAYVRIDPYANAFKRAAAPTFPFHDTPTPDPWVWERKFELDSLCHPIILLHDYWQTTGDSSIFDGQMLAMLGTIIQTLLTEHDHAGRSTYTFARSDPVGPYDQLPNGGRGYPLHSCGLLWSGFRPSDDVCTLNYNIPANMLAVVALGYASALLARFYPDSSLRQDADHLRRSVDAAIQQFGVYAHPQFGPLYGYEVDGAGKVLLMDDANVPSLLAIPYFGYRHADDPIYQNTRRFILSIANPYYAVGRFARGVGSPHTPPGYVWPIALAMQGLTSNDLAETTALVQMLSATTAGTQLMHESFHPDDPARYTRPWFAWANSLYSELVIHWASQAGLTQLPAPSSSVLSRNPL